MRCSKFILHGFCFLFSLYSSFAIGVNERFTVISKSNTYEGILFFATASMLFLVLFVFIHWGVRRIN